MKPDQLASAIKKLRRAHELGRKIADKLDSGDGVQYRKVGYRDAAKSVSEDEKLEKPISPGKARNYAMFTRRYTKADLTELVAQCREHKHCPGFDVVVRLMVIDESVRQELTLKVLENGWGKVRLGQEMRRTNATQSFKKRDTNSLLEHRNRGRKPKAVSDIESLFGELQDDAIKWQRVHSILSDQRDSEDAVGLGAELTDELIEDIEKLTNVFKGFFEYE